MTTLYVQILWLTDWGLFGKSWNIVFAAVLLFVALIKKSGGVSRNIKLNSLDILFIVIFFYGIFEYIHSYFFLENYQSALVGFRRYYFGIVVYFVTRLCLVKLNNFKTILATYFFMVSLVSTEVILETILFNLGIIAPTDLPWWSSLPEDVAGFYGQGETFLHIFSEGFIRPGGLLGSIPHTGNFIAMGVLLALPFVYRNKGTSLLNSANKTYIFFSVTMIALFSTSSRQVIIPTLTVFIFYIIFAPIRFSLSFLAPAGFAVALFVVLGVSESWFASLISAFERTNPMYRAELWDIEGIYTHYANLDIVTTIKSFLWGQGFTPPGYIIEMMRGRVDYYFTSSEVGIVLMFSEIGIVGVIQFIMQNILAVKSGLISLKGESDQYIKDLLRGLLLAVIVVSFSSSIHYFSLGTPGVQAIYYIMMGIISGLYEARKKRLSGLSP